MNYINKLSDNSQGIFYAILSCFYVSIMVGMVRHLSMEFNVFFVIMMRNFFAFMFFVPQIVKTRARIFKTERFGLHLVRNINGFVGMSLWFYAVTLVSLSDAISITFIVPIITTFAAMVFLREKVGAKAWISMVIGFIGILIIIRPGFKEFHSAYILTFAATVTWAITNVIIKIMTKTERPNTIVAYMSLLTFLISLPFGLYFAKEMSLTDVFWFSMIGLFSNLAHVAMTNSYAKVDLSVVQPFDFLRLIFTSIVAYVFFDEVLDFYTFIGAVIIMFGVIFVAPKKKTAYNEAENDI